MSKITLSCPIEGRETGYENVSVINPGDWFGRVWVLSIQISNWPIILAVEADSLQDALDELADSEQYGHLVTVEEPDLADYPEEDRNYGPSGQVVDYDNVMYDIDPDSPTAKNIRYHHDRFPPEGLTPGGYCEWMEDNDIDE